MRITASEHEAGAWRIAEIAPDFRLEDAWALPAHGSATDFPALLETVRAALGSGGGSRASRVLVDVRRRVGALLGWDRPPDAAGGTGAHQRSLRARLPADLRDTAPADERAPAGFTVLYLTDREWAAELSNRTVHAVMQLGWVRLTDERYEGRMGVYVKPRGRLGKTYMLAIAPFRHLIVYPALMRQVAQEWRERGGVP